MGLLSIPRNRRPRPQPAPFYDSGDIAIVKQVQNALNLSLTLKSRAQMPAVGAIIAAQKDAIHEALQSLHYVHFARFLPTPDYSALQVVTSYDGDLQSYLMDFVNVLGPVFNALLDFVQDAPRLPVERYPQDFIDFVSRNNMSSNGVWSAYPLDTVIDIQSAPGTIR